MDPQQELLNKYSLTGVLDRIEEDKAIIRLDDGQEILWPKSKLPEESKEGEVIKIKLSTNRNDTEEREKIVKKLLEEILKREE
jgi:hypothetical protein